MVLQPDKWKNCSYNTRLAENWCLLRGPYVHNVAAMERCLWDTWEIIPLTLNFGGRPNVQFDRLLDGKWPLPWPKGVPQGFNAPGIRQGRVFNLHRKYSKLQIYVFFSKIAIDGRKKRDLEDSNVWLRLYLALFYVWGLDRASSCSSLLSWSSVMKPRVDSVACHPWVLLPWASFEFYIQMLRPPCKLS